MSGEKKSHRKSIMSLIQDGIIWIFFCGGLILLGIAAVMPFKVKEYYETRIENYKTIADLGAVGDFIGGTTVAFLTAASVILLLATIIMQRKEIKISQQSIEELVKQTEASVEQAEEARKETKVANETMKRQQFETTFFNMINLHRSIIENLRDTYIKDDQEVEIRGRMVLEDFLVLFVNDYWRLAKGQLEELKNCPPENVDERLESMRYNINVEFNEDVLRIAYDEVFFLSGGYIKGYLHSLITIIKFLRDSQYEKIDRENGSCDNQVYREILFAQLTISEMLLLYYHAQYSENDTWLKEELKLYNIFYPRLIDVNYLFDKTDRENIGELSNLTK
ncbi:TPA: putative phage abortive infection protein [Bacillus cereus]|uniref:putative phage abortive infection protein n=1 Tax=Bacillus thuringiensis TaxID=1428 RepID=UPI000BF4DDEF|nr:putative phage abortive infection protein [Bacillus thuringiensis]PFA06410.1 hypothetical protein CN379_15185 [Bacillus thuringiensis]PFU01409.1 hypothetical protein COK75_17865 [Bacillus thuringiensis]